MRFIHAALLLSVVVLASVEGATPTQVDLRTQSKSVDFSSANSTKPLKSGTALPATCSAGDMYFKTDAPAGSNIYGCVGANTWSVQAGASGGTGALAGDVNGQSGANTVTQIQGRPVAATAPSTGQALIWNGVSGRWEPQSGGSGGASSAAQLSDFLVTKSAGNVLTIGANCSSSSPCNVRFGAVVYSFSSGVAATLAGGTGDAFIYIANSGALTIGHNMTLSCPSPCVAQGGVTSFPFDSVPLFRWHATGNVWDPVGLDQRAFISGKNVTFGSGLTTLDETSGRTTISADGTVIGLRVSAPSTSGTSCTSGSWAMDATFYYLCVTSNTWRRVQLSTWLATW